MADIKPVTVIESRPCGFCATHVHDHCPGGVIGMHDTKVWHCTCGCPNSERRRCFTCNLREEWDGEEISATTWRCIDVESCLGRVEERLAANPTIVQIRETAARLRGEEADLDAPVRVRGVRPTSARATTGKCLHCGEPTKGGKFLPGHDAAYLSGFQKSIAAGEMTVEAAKAKLVEDDVSPALQAKFEKRISK